MKKILAAILTLFCVVSVLAFSACTDVEEVENIIKDEETWNSAFENLEYVNFSMRVKIDNEDYVEINYCEISENAVYYNLHDYNVFYSIKNDDGTYTTYEKRNDDYVILADTTNKYFSSASRTTVVKVSYADYFERFTFDKDRGYYFCKEEIETTAYSFDGQELGTAYCFNNEIKIDNNKIVYMKFNLRDDNVEKSEAPLIEYFNIDSTVVTVPEDVIKNAVKESE